MGERIVIFTMVWDIVNLCMYLYNIIWEVSFLCVVLTLILTMVDYTITFNELKILHLKYCYFFIFSFLFKFFQKIYTYNKKGKLKKKQLKKKIYVCTMWFHKKGKVHKIVILH